MSWGHRRALRHLLGRHHGQHPPRQCIDKLYSPDSARRPAETCSNCAVSNAPALPDGHGAVALGALAGGMVLDEPLRAPLIGTAPTCGDTCCRLIRHRRRGGDLRSTRHRFRHIGSDPFTGSAFPADRHRGVRRRRDRTARRDRAVGTCWGGVHGTGAAQYAGLPSGGTPADPVDRGRPAAPHSDGERSPGPIAGDRQSRHQVGGVQYRAWQPPSALHPITVDGPLQFRTGRRHHRPVQGAATRSSWHTRADGPMTPPVNGQRPVHTARQVGSERPDSRPARSACPASGRNRRGNPPMWSAPGILNLRRVRDHVLPKCGAY